MQRYRDFAELAFWDLQQNGVSERKIKTAVAIEVSRERHTRAGGRNASLECSITVAQVHGRADHQFGFFRPRS